MNDRENYRFILIGASAGGFKAVVRAIGEFKGRENAVFIVVLHGFSEAPATLGENMSKLMEMPVVYADNGTEIKGKTVFFLGRTFI